MLALPQAPCEIPTKYPKSSGRALTLEQQLAADDAKVKAKAAAKEKKSKGKKSKQKQAKQDQSTLEPAQVREEPQDGARSAIGDADLFGGLVICVTGVTMEERDRVRAAVECRGGVFSCILVTNECTHLLAWKNTGAKFNCAAQHDICTVHPNWLLDSINKNELQCEVDYFVHSDDDDYCPPGPELVEVYAKRSSRPARNSFLNAKRLWYNLAEDDDYSGTAEDSAKPEEDSWSEDNDNSPSPLKEKGKPSAKATTVSGTGKPSAKATRSVSAAKKTNGRKQVTGKQEEDSWSEDNDNSPTPLKEKGKPSAKAITVSGTGKPSAKATTVSDTGKPSAKATRSVSAAKKTNGRKQVTGKQEEDSWSEDNDNSPSPLKEKGKPSAKATTVSGTGKPSAKATRSVSAAKKTNGRKQVTVRQEQDSLSEDKSPSLLKEKGKSSVKAANSVSGPGKPLAKTTRSATKGSKRPSTDCSDGACCNGSCSVWVACDACGGWYHCVCVNLTRTEAKEKDFLCGFCK